MKYIFLCVCTFSSQALFFGLFSFLLYFFVFSLESVFLWNNLLSCPNKILLRNILWCFSFVFLWGMATTLQLQLLLTFISVYSSVCRTFFSARCLPHLHIPEMWPFPYFNSWVLSLLLLFLTLVLHF